MKQQCFNGDGKHPKEIINDEIKEFISEVPWIKRKDYQDLENKALDFDEIAKNIVGEWGYEEEYWWKPISKHLQLAYEAGREEEKKMQTPPEFLYRKELESRNEVADYWYRHGVKSERERVRNIVLNFYGGKMPAILLDEINNDDKLLQELTK
jgi:hypothetical protein